MNDPNSTIATDSASSSTYELLLTERFPVCFSWENPRPLKIGIFKDLLEALGEVSGRSLMDLKKTVARYCNRPRYQKCLQEGAIRIDLEGKPAGVVTAESAAHANVELNAWNMRKAAAHRLNQWSLMANGKSGTDSSDPTPLPKEHCVPGRLELVVKFFELPAPLILQDGVKIEVETREGTVTTTLSLKSWRRLEQTTKDYPVWVAMLSGPLGRMEAGEITLQNPVMQVFERKPKPVINPAASEGDVTEHLPTTPESASLSGDQPAATSS